MTRKTSNKVMMHDLTSVLNLCETFKLQAENVQRVTEFRFTDAMD